MDFSREQLIDVYRRMRLIRAFEDKLADLVMAGRLPGFFHLYAGEEAVAVGVCSHLGDRDYITSTHRGHGHSIAKGVDVHAMMAELFGRTNGVCKGKGGSMHIADIDRGMLGANGIVGAGIPLAVGAGLTASIKKTGGVAVAFFGDGASNQGQFHEGLNLAAVWKLPVVFVVENNLYGEATPYEYVTPVRDIAERAASYGMPGEVADGMDFFAVYETAGKAIARARAGEGPSLLEFKTYRYYGHYVGDPLTYRTEEEANEVKTKRDPLLLFANRVTEEGLVEREVLETIDGQIAETIADAVGKAEQGPLPSVEDVTKDVYATL
ncbi:MAG: thiamine pyrophosphate-dependent dehydrogenase E1 component subunit alpha [Deltaproteobacteria bacterium]|nr:MAG: thiamine pyrophosphate-dependent dehydrogenase E1 component subunit alpha [Deltaproteobacteria bacterium]